MSLNISPAYLDFSLASSVTVTEVVRLPKMAASMARERDKGQPTVACLPACLLACLPACLSASKGLGAQSHSGSLGAATDQSRMEAVGS